ALQPVQTLAESQFSTDQAKALFTGMAAHIILPLNKLATSAIGLVLGMMGHAIGWPFPKGGSYRISDALAQYFTELGGKIETNANIQSLKELPEAHTILFDTTPKQIVRIAGQA